MRQRARVNGQVIVQISGPYGVGVIFLIIVPLLFGSSALWAYRRSFPLKRS